MALPLINKMTYSRLFVTGLLAGMLLLALVFLQDSTTVVNPFHHHQAPFEHPTPVKHSPSFEHPSTETWIPHRSPGWDWSTTGTWAQWTTKTRAWAYPTGTAHTTQQLNSTSRHSIVPTGISSSTNRTVPSMSSNATIPASTANLNVTSANVTASITTSNTIETNPGEVATASATVSSVTITVSSSIETIPVVNVSVASSASAASGSGTSSSSASTISSAPSATGTGALPPFNNGTGANVYNVYQGNGSPEDGWPTMDQWSSLTYLFNVNRPWMRTSCAQWNVPNNSPQEQADLEASIRKIGAQTGVDPRFILAAIMQESTGCVRVITTVYSHENPGLMQSFRGTGSCNNNGTVLTPCPRSEIEQQILDGVNGTQYGPGLVQDLAGRPRNAQGYYIAARIYNGGTYDPSNLAEPCCTPSYASDIANRLTGWTTAPRTFPTL